MNMLQNPMVLGAEARYDALCEYAAGVEAAVESELDQMMADADYVEEALSENADLVRVAIDELEAHPARGAQIAERLKSMIRSHLTAQAMRHVERAL